MTYFTETYKDLQDLRRHYYRLAVVHHPDHGGSEDVMKAINSEYEKISERIAKSQYESYDEWTWDGRKKFWEADAALRVVLNNLVHMNNIVIEVCGSWVWVTGNTKEIKDELKSLGLKFSGKKVAWYWHDKGYRKQTKNEWSLDKIRKEFGSYRVEDEDEGRMITA